jgi:hypothetical protein
MVLTADVMNAQAWHEKSQHFQIGVGDSYVFKTRINENEKNYTSKNTGSLGKINIKCTPAFFLKFETAVNKYIGVGVSVGYRKTELTQVIPYTYYDTTTAYPFVFGGYYYPQRTAYDIFTFKINDLSIGGRINCHFLPGKKVDPYIGGALGYRLFNRDYSYTTDNPHGVYYVVEYENILPIYASATLGVRYLFSNDLGVYAEVGIDKWSVIQGGIVLKIQ